MKNDKGICKKNKTKESNQHKGNMKFGYFDRITEKMMKERLIIIYGNSAIDSTIWKRNSQFNDTMSTL